MKEEKQNKNSENEMEKNENKNNDVTGQLALNILVNPKDQEKKSIGKKNILR